MACNFDNNETTTDLEIQIKDYIIQNYVDTAVAVQTNQVTAFMNPTEALMFKSTHCSDIIEIILDEPEGNRQLYKYISTAKTIEIWVYTIKD